MNKVWTNGTVYVLAPSRDRVASVLDHALGVTGHSAPEHHWHEVADNVLVPTWSENHNAVVPISSTELKRIKGEGWLSKPPRDLPST